ncbi:hypothetical protein ACMFMF_007704 [Clarireedia jacksonii]
MYTEDRKISLHSGRNTVKLRRFKSCSRRVQIFFFGSLIHLSDALRAREKLDQPTNKVSTTPQELDRLGLRWGMSGLLEEGTVEAHIEPVFDEELIPKITETLDNSIRASEKRKASENEKDDSVLHCN